MRNLALVASLLMLVAGVVVACAGDDRVKHLSDGGSGGVGGSDAGGVDGVGQGGGTSNPAAGAGGAPQLPGGGQGGTPEVNGNGGTGAPSPVEEGGSSSVGGGGGGGGGGGAPLECPAQKGTFTHQCADAVTTWAPIWNNSLARFELQFGELPFPLASGSISFFYNNADSQQCGTVPIQITATGIVAPVNVQFPPIAVRITTFTFTDVCGNTHAYDAAGAPACNDIRASGTGFGNDTLTCNTRLSANCPEGCT